MSANPERGEINVELDGVAHVLTPSYEARVAISRQTGKSIQQLAVAAGDGSLMEEDAAIVVCECIRAHGKATGDRDLQSYNPRRVGECLAETAMLTIDKKIELLLYLALTGGYTAKGEIKARPATVTATEPTRDNIAA